MASWSLPLIVKCSPTIFKLRKQAGIRRLERIPFLICWRRNSLVRCCSVEGLSSRLRNWLHLQEGPCKWPQGVKPSPIEENSPFDSLALSWKRASKDQNRHFVLCSETNQQPALVKEKKSNRIKPPCLHQPPHFALTVISGQFSKPPSYEKCYNNQIRMSQAHGLLWSVVSLQLAHQPKLGKYIQSGRWM